jgi:hypothetical protein
MNRFQIENIYRANGLDHNYKLRNTEDLLKCHGVNFKVEGYDQLNEEHKELYKKFIVNIFNAWGLEHRAQLIPLGIYWVRDIEFLTKTDPDDDVYTIVGGMVTVINNDGTERLLREWQDNDYKCYTLIKDEPRYYLRFEYQDGFRDNGEPRKEWLHVTKEDSWY